MTNGRVFAECRAGNRAEARFCRRCGAPFAPAELLAEPGGSDAAGVADEPASVDEQRVFIELCWLCGAALTLSVVYAIVARLWGLDPRVELSATAAVGVLVLVSMALNGALVRAALRLPSLRDLRDTLLVALVAGPALSLGFSVLQRLGFTLYSSYLTVYVHAGWPVWVGFASIAGVTPVCEELLFRGVIQPKLEQIIAPTEALIVQAALFSALHLSVVILITHFAMNLAFGWIRRRTGSLLPGMLLHGAWNFWVLWSTLS